MPTEHAIELYKKFQRSPIYFIFKIWGLVPQPLRPDYQQAADDWIASGDLTQFTEEMFKPFIKGRHITWQQWLILLAVEMSLQGLQPSKISVASGHGIGKTAVLAWLILWFLFCFKDAQVPCTAPTSEQIHDILWKEISIWMRRMPSDVQEKFEWAKGYIRIVESPETWFARARTARKENPEALAGVHGDFVLLVADEASGIFDEIFKTAEGAMTGENVLVLLISNYTRNEGYFHDTHTIDKHSWQNFNFDSTESPIVDEEFVNRIANKYGIDSDEFRIRVSGQPPAEDSVDDQGWSYLFNESDIRVTFDGEFSAGRKRLGVDPSGEGTDDSAWAVRDKFKLKVAATEKISNKNTGTQKSLTLMTKFDVEEGDVIVDNFGEGANWVQGLAVAGQEVVGRNVGDPPTDTTRFSNRRAENFFRLRDWMRSGGEMVNHPELKKELKTIKFRRNLRGKIEIMPKRLMLKLGYKSPNLADAAMLTCDGEDWELPEKKDDYVEPEYEAQSEYEGGLHPTDKRKHPMFKGVKIGQLGHKKIR